ncbi:hypothetical protein ACVW0P_000684 [Mucilaginibacter sp. UYNi724]
MTWNIIPDIVEKAIIPIIIGFITYLISKKQIVGTGVTQFRQRWIDELRKAVTLYIAKAEMIAMMDLDDQKTYFSHFQELAQMQYQIELMLNPGEDDHIKINVIAKSIRNIVHDESFSDEILEKMLTQKIEQLLKATKSVLKTEWQVVKKGR